MHERSRGNRERAPRGGSFTHYVAPPNTLSTRLEAGLGFNRLSGVSRGTYFRMSRPRIEDGKRGGGGRYRRGGARALRLRLTAFDKRRKRATTRYVRLAGRDARDVVSPARVPRCGDKLRASLLALSADATTCSVPGSTRSRRMPSLPRASTRLTSRRRESPGSGRLLREKVIKQSNVIRYYDNGSFFFQIVQECGQRSRKVLYFDFMYIAWSTHVSQSCRDFSFRPTKK